MLSFHPFFNFKAYTKYGGIYLNLPLTWSPSYLA
jgi:hypothetical protein